MSKNFAKLCICGASMKPFLDDIFGQQEGTHLFTGLVDSESSSDFDQCLQGLRSQWNERECELRSSTKPLFYDWFSKYHSTNFKEHMLKPLRVKAGLGDPPTAYTNNANESANARIKAKVDYKKSDLNVFCNEMKALVERQFRDVERAFTLNTGPYEVAPDYLSHRENATKWVKRSASYKQRVINSLYKLPLVDHVPNNATPDTSMDCGSTDAECTPKTVPLSISWQDTGLSGEVFEGMWTKASRLVGETNSVTPAPGLDSSRMVSSSSNPRKPHLVTFYKNGKITCDCQNCSIKHICAHILATAEKERILEDFLEWFKREIKGTNLWALARSSGVPKNPGNKPACRKRSRNALPQVKTTSDKLHKPDDPSRMNPISPQTQLHPPIPGPYDPYCGMHYSGPSTHYYPHDFCYYPPASPHSPHSPYFHPTPFYSQQNFHPGSTSFTSPLHNYSLPAPTSVTPTTSSLSQPNSSNALETVFEPTTSAYPFTVKKMTARIKKCQGCKQLFQDSSSSNLVVSRLECRPFVSPDGSVKVPKTPKNSHYHLSMECLTNADPSFHPQKLQLPNELKVTLSGEQMDSLRKFGF